jgi:hypothetical protein
MTVNFSRTECVQLLCYNCGASVGQMSKVEKRTEVTTKGHTKSSRYFSNVRENAGSIDAAYYLKGFSSFSSFKYCIKSGTLLFSKNKNFARLRCLNQSPLLSTIKKRQKAVNCLLLLLL